MRHNFCVVPARNEEGSIRTVLKRICHVAPTIRIVVVNDASEDKTSLYAHASGAKVINLKNNIGSGGATLRGLKYANQKGASCVVVCDADGQHNAHYIPKMIAEIENGADYVIAGRYGSHGPLVTSQIRVVGSAIISLWLHWWYGVRIHDPTSGYRTMSKRALSLFSRNYPTIFSEPVAIMSAVEHGLTVKEIPCVMQPRMYGSSSISFIRAVSLMVYILTTIPVRGITRMRRIVSVSDQ